MFKNKLTKNVFGTLILAGALFCLYVETSGQCSNAYFKRLSTKFVPINGVVFASVDMTGDGIPDLIGRSSDTSQNLGTQIFISPGNGSGGFGSPITINEPSSSLHFWISTIGDFDNDNFKDFIALFNTNPQALLVYKNNGNGTFTPQTLTPANFGIISFLDINNDGKGDLITTTSSTNVRYSLGNGDGTFGTPVQFANSVNILSGDFNNDGKIDFISQNNLLINQGGGIFTTISNAVSLGSNEVIKDVRDYTGDGKPDILTKTESLSSVKISLLTNLGSNSFQRADYPVASNQPNANWYGDTYVGNFSGNSSPDIVLDVYFLNKTIVFTNDGSGNLSAQTYDYKFNGKFTGDFDSDGKTDLVNVSSGNENGYFHKLFNGTSLTIQKNVCNQPGQARLVDFDRSGSTDYTYWTPANGKWSSQTSGNNIHITQSANWGLGALDDIPQPGDFDGDGITDFAVYRNSTGVWWVRRSSDLTGFSVQFGVTGDKPVSGDFDGDGITDLAVFRPSDGNWYILFMGTQSYTIVHWGANGDKPVPEDYDGDGKTDLAVFRPSTGVWYYLQSSDNNYGALQWGVSTDKLVPADYDGDGKADVAIYRESENRLYVLGSYNYSFVSYQFGSFQDIPQLGDFDGDFVADFAIYRPFSQAWYSVNSQEQTNFGSSSIIPTSSILRIE